VIISTTVTVPERPAATAAAVVSATTAVVVPVDVAAASAAFGGKRVEAPDGAAVDVPTAMQRLVLRIREKLDASKTPVALMDFSRELAGFDAIVAGSKDAKPDELAQVLMAKAQFYVQVLNDFDNAAKTIARIKADFPEVEIAAHADEIIADLRRMEAKHRARKALTAGSVFPEFTAKSLDGAEVSLAQFRGKVVLLDFWATWCPPCVFEMPRLKALHEKYREKGFVIVGISLDESESALRNFIKQHSIAWVQLFDGKGWETALAEKFGIDSVPTMYLLDAEGKIIGSNHEGLVLEEQLGKLLGK